MTFLRLRDEWPVKGIEIKGSKLDESQTAQVIVVCKRHDVLVNFVALNMATHDHVTVEDVKRHQAAVHCLPTLLLSTFRHWFGLLR